MRILRAVSKTTTSTLKDASQMIQVNIFTKMWRYFKRILRKVISKIFHVVEIIIPAIPHHRIRRNKLRLLEDEGILDREEYAQFINISSEDLQTRLNQENKRATAINEKTYKMGLSLSIALTIIGYASTALPEQMPDPFAKACFSGLIISGVVYFMVAGIVALKSIRTEPIYGATTQIVLLQGVEKQQCLAKCLAQSEEMNIIRHIRNELVYQCLRLGYYLFLCAIVLFIGSQIFKFFFSINQ
ncbi:MAG: hypothetical protein OXE59_08095 [Bacteroidetes bacterium]|nr:hypothetical protein [Bacteroidota bacterium]